VVEQGDADQVFQAPQHEITKLLLDAIPKGLAQPLSGN
jgi:ABC-type oligopeptide transport system ATPase subunit